MRKKSSRGVSVPGSLGEALETYQVLHSVLKQKGIRAMAESSVGVFSVSVPESDASVAVNTIVQAPELKGKSITIFQAPISP